MKKALLSLLLLLSLSIPLWAQTFQFSNDGLTWGFLPEWDDWETNSFCVSTNYNQFFGDVEYRVFTDRELNESDSSRLDAISVQGGMSSDFALSPKVSLAIRAAVSAQLFGDFLGFELQTGWHNNVEVHRQVPIRYDSSYREVSIPLSAELSLAFPIETSLILKQEISYPLVYSGSIGVGLKLPDELLPLKVVMAYDNMVGERGNKTLDASLEKQTGFNFSSSLNFWPFNIEKRAYINRQWGNGSLGIHFTAPRNPPPEDMLMEIHFLGFTHQSYGLKVMYQFLHTFSFLYSGVYYQSMAGWMDAPYIFPEGGRFSELLLGFEQGAELNIGSFRTSLYFQAGSGFAQDQFYVLNSTALQPLWVKNSWVIKWGGGARILFPFLYERKIGVGFDITRKHDILSSGNWPENLASDEPWNYTLSFVVSH